MRYCALGGGKRLRPAFVCFGAEAAGSDEQSELRRRCAVAVELVHCYSLVHDDLPAMDNDVLRRGRATAHVKFGEAMAILTGDALLTRAMGVLAESADAKVGRLTLELAGAAGPAGMIAGQVADMGLCEVEDGPAGLRYIHSHKSAALIRAAARIGAICAGADDGVLAAISKSAEWLGLAFQVVDDILDVTSDAPTLGKTPRKDQADKKRTHVSLLGMQRAVELADEMTANACAALDDLGEAAQNLRRLAQLLGRRTH